MRIFVTMEGGLCQCVSTDNPDLVGIEYVVVDYDTDGSSDELSEVVQADGMVSEACIGGGIVDLYECEIIDKPQSKE